MCVLCRPKPGTYTLDDLCPRHRADMEESLAAHRRSHPDGECFEGCGCVSLDAYMAARGLSER